ncbi:unnamed protein product [Euphydryas editha]|uniref:Uncharacterized protein n=1 Tax=Euphydryas editha TaxID=104508 RepID=A0AAU9US98_EUPED|nr:unnamed protein product [Euphydryas editha]
MNQIAISSKNVADAVRRAPNWKSPGADGLHHYWLKGFSSCKISRHIDEFNILSAAQNGCRGGGRGTKELLLIDSVAGQLVKCNRRNFSAAWIDYKKAFD